MWSVSAFLCYILTVLGILCSVDKVITILQNFGYYLPIEGALLLTRFEN